MKISLEKSEADAACVRLPELRPEENEAFSSCLRILREAGVPFVVACAFAVHFYTGIWRATKDLDLFLQAQHVPNALEQLGRQGFETEVRNPFWLAKAWRRRSMIDLIFAMSNGQLRVDHQMVLRGTIGTVCGEEVRIIPLEDLIASKIYVASRDRFDGADVVHLIERSQGQIDWDRVLERLGEHRPLLLWHLILFNYVYPTRASYLPRDLMMKLFDEVRGEWAVQKDSGLFRGTLLDEISFAVDITKWGYRQDPLLERQKLKTNSK